MKERNLNISGRIVKVKIPEFAEKARETLKEKYPEELISYFELGSFQLRKLQEQFKLAEEEVRTIRDRLQMTFFDEINLSAFSKRFRNGHIVHWNFTKSRWE
jgi:uncharacterized Rmd1/YagE family protein